MKYHKNAFSLVIAMLLVVLISLLAISILDYIVPFSRGTKGIENSVGAYYQANSGIESALYEMKTKNIGEDMLEPLSSLAYAHAFVITASGSRLPITGAGNSEFDSDWNRVRVGEPIQLEVGRGMLEVVDWPNVEFYFRVPDLDGVSSTAETLSGVSLPVINWTLLSDTDALNATNDTRIEASEVCNSKDTCNPLSFASRQGVNLDGDTTASEVFGNFYANECNTSSKPCTLKLSVINKLETIETTKVPYLEWYIDFDSKTVPLRYARIHAEGKSYGFKRDFYIRVAQQTISEAFDFTVFQ